MIMTITIINAATKDVISFDLSLLKIIVIMKIFFEEYCYCLTNRLNLLSLMQCNSHLFYEHLTHCKILQLLKYEL